MSLASNAECLVHVLLVDDSPSVRQAINRVLARDASVRVIEAEDGLAALERLDTDVVDLVFLDFNLPMMNGIDILRAIRRSPRHASLPVIVMTSGPDEAVVAEMVELGVLDFLVKPLFPQLLRSRLERIVESARSYAMAKTSTANPKRELSLGATSQVLVVAQDEDLKRLVVEQLQFVGRIDTAASATGALRQCHTLQYDAIFIARAAGLLDGVQLIRKVRESRFGRYPRLTAIVESGATPEDCPDDLCDAILLSTANPREWLQRLASVATPPSATRMLVGPCSPYVGDMFERALNLFQDRARTVVSFQSRPLLTTDHSHAFASSVAFRSNDLRGTMWLGCNDSFALSVVGAGADVQERLSHVQVHEALSDAAMIIADTLRLGFERCRVPFRFEGGVSATAAGPPWTGAIPAGGHEKWYAMPSTKGTASIRLDPM